jgi:hypothetical protein
MIWRICSASLLALGVALSGVVDGRVYACTPPGPDFDAVALSDAIVEGRFLGYEPLTDDTKSAFTPVRLDMDVERVFKGNLTPGPLAIVDPVSLMVLPSGEEVWAGSSGACGAFDHDPTGKYAILGLSLEDNGTLRPSRLFYFFFGEGPQDDRYADLVASLESRLQTAVLPDTGTGASDTAGFPLAALAAGLAVGGAALILGSAARSMRRRS